MYVHEQTWDTYEWQVWKSAKYFLEASEKHIYIYIYNFNQNQ